MVYFDHNATAPMLPEARQAWLDAAERFIGNPSSPHRVGARAEAALNDARGRVAEFLGCDALDIVWTSGATEANNLALHHFARTAPEREAWVSAIEHPCVLEAVRFHFPNRVREIPAGKDGRVQIDWLREQLGHARPAVVAVMAANNETGVLQPWDEARALCAEAGVPFLCDATQWLGRLPATGLGKCDLVSGSAHKFGGPKGVGFLKCPGRGHIEPLLRGGGQEEGRRAGTENVPGIVAMVAALSLREQQLSVPAEQARREALRTDFEDALIRRLPGSEVVGAGSPRLWNTVSALMPERDCQQRWVVKLDRFGFAVSTGSACASGKERPSHVLSAMGCSASEAGRVLRFSSGWETTAENWSALLEGLGKVAAALPVAER